MLLDLEPQLRGKIIQAAADVLTAVGQEDFQLDGNITARLARLTWPATVAGYAIVMKRILLPLRSGSQVPVGPDEAIEFVNNHKVRTGVQVVVDALRDRPQYDPARALNNPENLFGVEDLVPGLTNVLLTTFKEGNV